MVRRPWQRGVQYNGWVRECLDTGGSKRVLWPSWSGPSYAVPGGPEAGGAGG